MITDVQLVALDQVQPAAYNPREADPDRLDLLTTSIKKLGFILPLFALRDGHLLSGHQRLEVARQLGCTQVPIQYVDANPEALKGINILFNRCTNDMRSTDTSENLAQTLPIDQLQQLLDSVPDLEPSSPQFFRCANPEWVDLEVLLQNLTRKFETNAVGINRKLQHMGVHMPVVINADGAVINGSYRLMALAETKTTRLRMGTWPSVFPAIRLSNEESRLADLLLNMVSMKFTVEKQYADLLRWGAYRRQENKVSDLPQSFRILVNDWKASSAKEDLEDNEIFWQKFRKSYGEKIVDFGAGQRRVKPLLAKKGIHCAEFEPYPCDWRNELQNDEPKDLPNLTLARKVTDEFLVDVAAKTPYSSVVLAAVMNSVPFHYDRMCVLAVCHSLCNFGGQIVGQARALDNSSSVNYLKNRTDASGHHLPAPSTFLLDYEPNITLGNVGRAPKVQKAHSDKEIQQMLSVFFETVQLNGTHNYIWFLAKNPKRINYTVLAKAIRHEFDLPWQSGERLGRADAAIAAFSERLGINLEKHV